MDPEYNPILHNNQLLTLIKDHLQHGRAEQLRALLYQWKFMLRYLIAHSSLSAQDKEELYKILSV